VAPGVAAAFAAIGEGTALAGRDEARTQRAARAASSLAGACVDGVAIEPDTFNGVRLIVECVIENLEVKQHLLGELASWIASSTVVVSNTSSLPLDDLVRPLRYPGKFAGLHFLHPAHLTRVVEIVPAAITDPSTIEHLVEIAARMNKQPIVLRHALPGYVWNRLQMAVLRECLHLLAEGVADADAIDSAVADGLAPRWLAAGPLATADAGGLATFAEVARQLFPVISSATVPSEFLAAAEHRGGIYAWTPDELSLIDQIRADALKAGAAIAADRPRPRPHEDASTAPTDVSVSPDFGRCGG
jgi:3-hydroxybutyryl-CoA dehydrogenase